MTAWIETKRHFEARSLEWVVGMMLTAWGAYVILHPGLFDSQPYFYGMMTIFPQEYWGLSAFVAGSVRLTALFINGRWGLTPIIRVFTSFMSIFVWFWVSIGLYRTGIPAPGLVIYPGFVIADMVSAFRAMGDAYEAETMRRLRKLSEAQDNVSAFPGRNSGGY